MKAPLLAAYKRGEISYRELATQSEKALGSLAAWHHRRWSRLYQPTRLVEVEDLVQVARLAMWQAVEAYVWRCSVCERDAVSEADFQRHAVLRHPEGGAEAKPTLLRWVTGRVGNALLGEIRATVKRSKVRPIVIRAGSVLGGDVDPDDLDLVHGPMPGFLFNNFAWSVQADQEVMVDFHRLVDMAGPQVAATAAEIYAVLTEGRAVG